MFATGRSSHSTPVSPDTSFNYVSLLLNGDGTNGAQNNTFLDSSSNAFTITRNGTPTQGTFSPYGTLWSSYWDGSSNSGVYWPTTTWQSLATATSWTAEFWMFPTANGATNNGTIYGQNVSGQTNSQWITLTSSNKVGIVSAGSGAFFSPSALSSSTIQLNVWTHVAITVSNSTPSSSTGTVKIYINGVLDSTTTGVKTAVGNPGSYAYSGSREDTNDYNYTGYLSNLRIVVGSLVYTSNFTPPTSPLTAISGTSTLIYQKNNYYDVGLGVYASAVGSATSIQRFSPFLPSSAYSSSVIGGSGYFNGSTDYLSTPTSTNLSFGTNSFTIECWYYAITKSSTNPSVIANNVSWTTNAWNLNDRHMSAPTVFTFWVNNINHVGSPVITGTTVVQNNTWYHLAVTRSGSSFTLFVNGVQDGTASSSTSLDGGVTQPIYVGASGSATYINGYVSDVRVTNGTAVYTSNFTPPTAPLTTITNTQLLTNMTNAGIIDNAMMNDLITVGSAQISTSVVKYGTGSISFDGSTSYLYMPTTDIQGQIFAFGTGNFTIECWAYVNNTSNQMVFIDFRGATGSTTAPVLYMTSSGVVNYYTSGSIQITGSTISSSTWYHLAVCRSGTSTKLFINGTQVGSTYSDSNNYAQYYVILGRSTDIAGSYLNGYLDDVRITKGYARYTANFTPPTSALSNY